MGKGDWEGDWNGVLGIGDEDADGDWEGGWGLGMCGLYVLCCGYALPPSLSSFVVY